MRLILLILLILSLFSGIDASTRNKFWDTTEGTVWWRRFYTRRPHYPQPLSTELKRFALKYFAFLTKCDVPQIMTLYTRDYSGWEADGDPVDFARQKKAIGYFCSPPTAGGFRGTNFTLLDSVQVGPSAIYIIAHIANHKFTKPFNFSQSLLLSRCSHTGHYRIRMEVQSLSGVRLRAAVGRAPTPGTIAVAPSRVK